MSDFAKSIFDTASSEGHPSELLIEGFNIEALTTSFVDKIKAAVADRDFAHILTPDRTFQIYLACHPMEVFSPSVLGLNEKFFILPFASSQTTSSFFAMGLEGNVGAFQSFFASYHDMQAIALHHCSIAQHRALGHEIVYCAVIRSQPPLHTKPEAFYKGLCLGCSNGFDFSKSYPGGSTTFLSCIWTLVIQAYQSLRPHMSIHTVSPKGLIPIGGPGSTIPDFRSILEDFLAGYGVPCPNLFAKAKGSLSALIPIGNMDSPAFQSRCLCWAVTGSPHVEFEDHQQINICFVGQRCWIQFSRLSLGRDDVSRLVRQTYPAKDKEGNDTEPFTAFQAIQHWLLMEILGAIGFHSMT
ncbi:hypothetical protein C8R43DRAFT_962553 [Mycena crocata]|nr:hypothetical protein C8R43DRAFT_962553 [Mycena crocata]